MIGITAMKNQDVAIGWVLFFGYDAEQRINILLQ